MNKQIIIKQAENHDSFYLYDEAVIVKSMDQLKQTFPNLEFLYSMKCNPNHHVLRCVFGQGFGADAASLGEVLMAADAGLPQDKIYYSAPGKTEKDIEASIDKAFLIADSIAELYRIQEVAASKGVTCEVGIRINPDYSFDDDQGHFSKFGVDQDQAFDFLRERPCANIKVTGLHIHLKSQELRTDVLARHYTKVFQLADQFAQLCGELKYLNLGSGIGVEYGPEDEPVDLQALGNVVNLEAEAFRKVHPTTRLMMETGRYTVCKSGTYVTKVIDRKVSRGKTILILKNTLNGFFKPAVARVIESYAKEQYPPAAEPLYTCRDAFDLVPVKVSRDADEQTERVALCGNLCTAMDMITDDILLPHLECGDLIIMTNAGSYAAVLSPMQFSSQEKPVELFLTVEGEIK